MIGLRVNLKSLIKIMKRLLMIMSINLLTVIYFVQILSIKLTQKVLYFIEIVQLLNGRIAI